MKVTKTFLVIVLIVIVVWLMGKTNTHRTEVLRLASRQDSISRRLVQGSIDSIRQRDSLKMSQETVFR